MDTYFLEILLFFLILGLFFIYLIQLKKQQFQNETNVNKVNTSNTKLLQKKNYNTFISKNQGPIQHFHQHFMQNSQLLNNSSANSPQSTTNLYKLLGFRIIQNLNHNETY